MKDRRVIVLGQDHTNTTGMVQCLGQTGFCVEAVLWGGVTGLVKSSKFARRVHTAATPQACIELIATKLRRDEPAAIIACCDDAAIALERNKELFGNNFRFEYVTGDWTIEGLCEKDLQVNLAKTTGFNVPWSSQPIETLDDVPDDVVYPCITKSLVSCKGSKSDLTIVTTREELMIVLKDLLTHTPRIILQQYIEHDYEISVLGCGLTTGEVVIPCIENKLKIYPLNVGLVSLANVQPLSDTDNIRLSICNLIKRIGYVGLFSVELMHSKADGLFYFTEINLRNDGANSFIYQYGFNLPLNHIEDLFDEPITRFEKSYPGYYIWEMHHTFSLIHRDINFRTWLSDIRQSRGFLLYFNEDKKPFFKQYSNLLLHKLRLKKVRNYE